MNETDMLLKIETDSTFFRDRQAKQKIGEGTIKSTVTKYFKYWNSKETVTEILPGNVIQTNNGRYHYYAQYNSGKTNVPWYGITDNVYTQLFPQKDKGNNVINGIFLIYIEYPTGKTTGTIGKIYVQLITRDSSINWTGCRDEKNGRYLLNYEWRELNQNYYLKKSNEEKMDVVYVREEK